LTTTIVNPVTAYGEGDFALRAGGKVAAEIERRGIGLIPPGGTSWIDIDDLAAGILLAAQRGKTGERYILAAGNISYRDLFAAIARALDRPDAGRIISPRWEAFLSAGARVSEVVGALTGKYFLPPAVQVREAFHFKYFDSGKARRELGFSPRVSFEESLQKTVSFSHRYNLFSHE
jgi:dihydroflavonol-4-reductase